MTGGSVGMSVNQACARGIVKNGGHRVRVDIHYLHGLVLFVLSALATQLFGSGDALIKRRGKERLLPARIAHLFTEFQVSRIVAAQGIAMHQQRWGAVKRECMRIGQQLRGKRGGQLRPNQKVTIAVHQKKPYSIRRQPRQGLYDFAVKWQGRSVVPGPIFKQVAENIKGLGMQRWAAQKRIKDILHVRARWAQMQIGDEQGRFHRAGLKGASLYQFSAFDNDVLNRHVLMAAFVAGFNFLDFVDDILAFSHFAEYAVAETLRCRCGMV